VSLSWRERVTIELSPRAVTMLRYGRGLRAVLKDRKSLPVPIVEGASAWQGAVDVLREVLTHPNIAPADATVVLSAHFVRYLLLPFNAEVTTTQEELAFGRARFVQVFGEAAQGWTLKLSPAQPGAPGVASAIPAALLEAVTQLMSASPLRVRSLQPSLMAICNERSQLPRGLAWLAIVEPGMLVLGAMQAGKWISLRSRPINGGGVSLAKLIEQEALLVGMEPGGGQVYLHRSGDVAPDLRGLEVRDWRTDRPVVSAPLAVAA
jgi:hypothetical protein